MLIKQIDDVAPESLKRGFSNFFDMFGSTIQLTPPRLVGGSRFEPKFAGNHHLFAHRSERFAYTFFVRERSVNFSCIEERDAKFNRLAKQRDHLLLVLRRTVAKAHSHAAEPDCRDFQIALPKFALLH